MSGKGKGKSNRRRGSAGNGDRHEGCEHDHGKDRQKAKRNAYETVPRRKGASSSGGGGGGVDKGDAKT